MGILNPLSAETLSMVYVTKAITLIDLARGLTQGLL